MNFRGCQAISHTSFVRKSFGDHVTPSGVVFKTNGAQNMARAFQNLGSHLSPIGDYNSLMICRHDHTRKTLDISNLKAIIRKVK